MMKGETGPVSTASPLRTFALGAQWSVIGTAASYAVSFSSTVFLARILDPQGYGAFRTVLSFIATAGLLGGFELRDAMRREIPLAQGDDMEVRRKIRAALTIASSATAVIVLVTVAGASKFAQMLEVRGVTAGTLCLAAVVVAAFVSSSTGEAILQGLEEYRAIATRRTVSLLIGMPLTVLLARVFGVTGAIAGTAATYALTTTLFTLRLSRFLPHVDEGFSTTIVRDMVKFSTPIVLVAVTVPLTNSWLNVELTHRSGIVTVGLFAAAMAFPQLVGAAISPINAPLIPFQVRALRASTRYQFVRLVRLSGGGYAVLAGAAAIVLCAWTEPVIEVVFGARFVAAAPLLKWLSIGAIFRAPCEALGRALVIEARTRAVLGVMAVSNGVLVAVYLALGGTGLAAAEAVLCANLTQLVVYGLLVIRAEFSAASGFVVPVLISCGVAMVALWSAHLPMLARAATTGTLLMLLPVSVYGTLAAGDRAFVRAHVHRARM